MQDTTDRNEALLDFFRTLADETRLKIVGLLARREYSVEELAAILDLAPPTISHHLQRLVQAGLAHGRAEAHYHVYSLQVETLHRMAQQILSKDTLQGTTEDLDLDAYERKVRRDYLVDGRLKEIPRQLKKREVILRYLVERFEPERRYPEREVNEVIRQVHEDYATLRRELVDRGYLARERDVYWRR